MLAAFKTSLNEQIFHLNTVTILIESACYHNRGKLEQGQERRMSNGTYGHVGCNLDVFAFHLCTCSIL